MSGIGGNSDVQCMVTDSLCLWCNKSYRAANPTTAPSAGLCEDCMNVVIPGLLKPSDWKELYGEPTAFPPPLTDFDPEDIL